MPFENLSRSDRRAMAAHSKREAAKRPEKLTEIPRSEWPQSQRLSMSAPSRAWHSQEFLIQLYDAGTRENRAVLRLSICRVILKDDGRWNENISWDDLMRAKQEVGFGDWYAIEVYPRDEEIVNGANMRHLWLLDEPLDIGWFKAKID